LKLEFGTGSRFSRLKYKLAKELVDHAINNGIRRFDSGFYYGNYRSQPLLARCLKNKIDISREEIHLSTKCAALSGEYINYSVNKSIDTFNSGYIDNLHLSGPSIKDIESNNIIGEISSLIKNGKIKKASVETTELKTMKKISTGFY
tara:strand:+ start:303 stop:743 length:441 start_codon:yes stop_codon:yes gene_type:complete